MRVQELSFKTKFQLAEILGSTSIRRVGSMSNWSLPDGLCYVELSVTTMRIVHKPNYLIVTKSQYTGNEVVKSISMIAL